MRWWLLHEPSRWRHERVVGHTDIWAHTLSIPVPAEREYLMPTHPTGMTKMGCARYLEVFDACDRDDLWRRLDKPALVAAFVGAPGGAESVAVDGCAGTRARARWSCNIKCWPRGARARTLSPRNERRKDRRP